MKRFLKIKIIQPVKTFLKKVDMANGNISEHNNGDEDNKNV